MAIFNLIISQWLADKPTLKLIYIGQVIGAPNGPILQAELTVQTLIVCPSKMTAYTNQSVDRETSQTFMNGRTDFQI